MKPEQKRKAFFVILLVFFCLRPSISAAECIKGDCINGEGVMVVAEGVKYTGQWRDGLRHGRGLMTFSDGRKYLGDWDNDRPHGQGTMTFSDGGEYVGGFANGMRHGKGSFNIPDGRKYAGEWQNDKPHGAGRMVFPDGHVYEGAWLMSLPQGSGVMTYPDGSIFKGYFEKGVRHGSGIITMPDGIKYEGTWKNDSPDGKAVIIYPDGERYAGLWLNGDFYRETDKEPAATGKSLAALDRQKRLLSKTDKPEDESGGQDQKNKALPAGDKEAIGLTSFTNRLAELPAGNSSVAALPGMYPEASARQLTERDLAGKSPEELSVMKNEIFARHSYIFKTEQMREYFNGQPWYKAEFSDVFPELTEIERSNIDFIADYQRKGPSSTLKGGK